MPAAELHEHRDGFCSGISTSTRISSGSRAVSYRPWKNASAGIVGGRTPLDHQGRAERQDAGRQLGGRVGERDAAERPAVAHRHVRDMRHRLGDQRQMPRDDWRIHHLDMARQRADPHRAVAVVDALEGVQRLMSISTLGCDRRMASVGIRLWPPARMRLVTVLGQQPHGVVEALRPHIGKPRRLHVAPCRAGCRPAGMGGMPSISPPRKTGSSAYRAIGGGACGAPSCTRCGIVGLGCWSWRVAQQHPGALPLPACGGSG